MDNRRSVSSKVDRVLPKEVLSMRPYERPTLTAAGSFKKVTGATGTGPRDTLNNKQLL
jgi:hypothetical protein